MVTELSRLQLLLLQILILVGVASSWTVPRPHGPHRGFLVTRRSPPPPGSTLKLAGTVQRDEDEGDWRDFRARLVFGEQQQQQALHCINNASTSPTSWAYDAEEGTIEQGSILLSSVEQDFGYGIKQQYFHKCVLLVTHHEEGSFTQGILLNRPTNLYVNDQDLIYQNGSSLADLNPFNSTTWRLWFGGEVQGLSTDCAEIVCVHSCKSQAAIDVSTRILKDIFWTTLENATKLVHNKEATSDEFWVFCGYAGWRHGQLLDELQRGCWHLVAASSNMVWKELKLQAGTNIIDDNMVGMDVTWERLMGRVGRGDEARNLSCAFDDSMLREWAKKNLVLQLGDKHNNKEKEENNLPLTRTAISFPLTRTATRSLPVCAGSLLKAGSWAGNQSPFLLSNQEFHKSVILVMQDEENYSIGVLLNRPSTETALELLLPGNGAGESRTGSRVVKIPQRYGGRFGAKGGSEKPVLWFHFNHVLREMRVGSPVGETHPQGVWKCTKQDAIQAIQAGIASEKDFIVVKGFNVWPKGLTIGEMESLGFVAKAKFDLVDASKTRQVWDTLVSQEVLSALTIDRNLFLGTDAWFASVEGESILSDSSEITLSDDALRSWMAAYLLGEPSLRHSQSAFG